MQKQITSVFSRFEEDGFALLKSFVSNEQIEQLAAAVELVRSSLLSPGVRNLLRQSETVKSFACAGLGFETATDLLGDGARAVRAILFDKSVSSNWYVTWHQDLAIPVKKRLDIEGYTAWSMKHGVLHVQPPAKILQNMVSLRVHLDDCGNDNGAIKFIAGTHKLGVLSDQEIAFHRDNSAAYSCPAKRGDIIIMRPLIMHSSSESQDPRQRRVLHLEYTCTDLPLGLEWGEA